MITPERLCFLSVIMLCLSVMLWQLLPVNLVPAVSSRARLILRKLSGKPSKTLKSRSRTSEGPGAERSIGTEAYRSVMNQIRRERGYTQGDLGSLSREWVICSMIPEQIMEMTIGASTMERTMTLVAEMIEITGRSWHEIMECIGHVEKECNPVCH